MSKRTSWAQWGLAALVGALVVGQAPGAKADPPESPGNSSDAPGRIKKTAVPEIPVGGVAAALTMLLGGAAIALDRRRRKAK
jgi:hypothetical protein